MTAVIAFACPGCGAAMRSRVDPDFTTEECTACGGTWLDRGELNSLVTGLGGDIELPAQHAAQTSAAQYRQRRCPRCDDTFLHSVWLSSLKRIQIEVCPKCQGMYLDAGEIDETNATLLGKRETPEMREWRDGRLVRLDRSPASGWGEAGFAYVLVVFFKQPLPFDLHITPLSWLDRLVALAHRSAQKVETNHPEFDRIVRVRSVEPELAAPLFSPAVRSAILSLIDKDMKLTFVGGSIEIGSKGIAYRERAHDDDKTHRRTRRPEEIAVEYQMKNLFSAEELESLTRRLEAVAQIIEIEAERLGLMPARE